MPTRVPTNIGNDKQTMWKVDCNVFILWNICFKSSYEARKKLPLAMLHHGNVM